MQQPLTDSLKYRQWLVALTQAGARVQQLAELHTVRKPAGDVLFSMVQMDATGADGTRLLPVAILRGHFVSVVTVLEAAETGERRLLLVRQNRVATGGPFYEHPAGMCDSDTDPLLVAMKELQEETGLAVPRERIIPLNKELYYSSPGLLDEGGYFFYTILRMPQSAIDALHGKHTGVAGEGEQLETVVSTLQDAFLRMRNISAQLNIFLYLQHTGQTSL